MRAKTYYPIIWYQNWHSCDTLNGIALQDGVRIEIKWPTPTPSPTSTSTTSTTPTSTYTSTAISGAASDAEDGEDGEDGEAGVTQNGEVVGVGVGAVCRATSESTLTVHEVKIIKESHTIIDMGHPYESTDSISEITIDYNNAKVVMRLRNTKEILARFLE